MTAFFDHAALTKHKAAAEALQRLTDLCRDLERDAAHADSPEHLPSRTFPLDPEDFPPPNSADLDDLVGEEPLFSRLRAGSSPYFE